MEKTRKLMYMSLLVAMALVLHSIERYIPIPFIAPGAKLGLSNLVVVIALYTLPTAKDVLKIMLMKVVLSTLVGGAATSFLYGAVGTVLSFGAMYSVKAIGKSQVSPIGVSVMGAVWHNIGQIFVACLIVWHVGITLYLPILTIAGVGTGIFIGMSAQYTLKHMAKLSFFREIIKKM